CAVGAARSGANGTFMRGWGGSVVVARLESRGGRTEAAELERAHDRVEREAARRLVRQALVHHLHHRPAQEEAVYDDDRDDRQQEDLHVARERGVRPAREERDDQDDQRVHVELHRPPVGVDEIPGQLLSRAAVAGAERPVLAAPHGLHLLGAVLPHLGLFVGRELALAVGGRGATPAAGRGAGDGPVPVGLGRAALGRRPALARLGDWLALSRSFRGLRALGTLGLAVGSSGAAATSEHGDIVLRRTTNVLLAGGRPSVARG